MTVLILETISVPHRKTISTVCLKGLLLVVFVICQCSLSAKETTHKMSSPYQDYERLGLQYSSAGLFPIELEYRFRMMEILDSGLVYPVASPELIKEYAGLQLKIGLCYFNMDNQAKALFWFGKSLESVEKAGKQDKTYDTDKKRMALLANMGSAYLSSYRFQEAENYFDKALQISIKQGNPSSKSTLYNNLGIIYKERKDYNKAFEYYQEALEIRTDLHDTAAMAQTYNNLGDAYFLTGQYDKAKEALKTALFLSRRAVNLRSEMKAANFLSLTYERTGNLQDALKMFKLYQQLHDSIIGNEEVQKASRLELQYEYKKQQREQEYNQTIKLAAKERKNILYMTLSGFFLLLIIILILLNHNQRMKMRQSKLQAGQLELERKNLLLETHNLNMEKQNLLMELDYKNKELNTYVMYLLKKNEFILSVIEKLKAVQTDTPKASQEKWYNTIIRELQSNVDHTAWSEFEIRFQQVHKEFYEKLLEKFPDLTPNEIKICAFLKLNMSTKDISAITFQSVKSIEVARNRMRKKMGLSRDENLVTALQML